MYTKKPFPKMSSRSRDAKLKSMVKKMLKGSQETKHRDTVVSAYTTIGYAGSVYHLSDVAQGTSENNRVGDKVHATYIKLGATMAAHATENTTMRVMLIQDKLNQGTAPSAGDILEGTGVTGGYRSGICELNVDDFPKRWRVLYDKTVRLVSGTASAVQVLKASAKINAPIWYSGSAGTDEGRNQIYLLLISDAAANYPSLVWNARLYYKDA